MAGMEVSMPIHVLDKNTIDKIAAGEVVERPSSVVKELVENAIDAGSTAITIEIKDGGISFIRITDNGCGIEKNEIPLAFLRHSTSKIQSIEDLVSVSSLGFRGEALSSIAAVAQVELITKTFDSLTGNRYVIEGGSEVSLEEVGAPDGTTFIIRNLFYNTPVRRKFLKSAATEAGYISSLIDHLALSHPDISFRFINNNQNRLHTSGNMSLKDIIYSVYGRDITNNLIEINDATQDIKMTGFIGKPTVCRGNRAFENYYINGRYIKSKIITSAIEEAYKGFIMLHNYPFTAIHFEVNPQILDVNVHPTKMELRFSKNEFVRSFVMNSLRNSIRNIDLIPEVSIDDRKYNVNNVNVANNVNAENSKKGENNTGVRQEDNKYKNYKAPSLKHLPAFSDVNTDIASHMATSVKNPYEDGKYKSGQYKADNYKTGHLEKSDITQGQETHTKDASDRIESDRLPEPFEIKRSDEMVKTDDVIAEENKATDYGAVPAGVKNTKAQQLSLFGDDEGHIRENKHYRIIGQLFETYWLIEFDDKFYMMDQHAAHEKIMYERLMGDFHNKRIDTQMLMPPVILSLSMREEEVLKSNMEAFTGLGYEIENFGGNEYKVTGVPANLYSLDYKQMLIDLIDELADDSYSGSLEIITQKIASMSCKAAVKGNNRLSFEEAEELMKELMQAENPYNCPHGRPTLIMMTKYEIEKKFKRIV